MEEYTEDYLRELHEAFLLRDKDNSGLIEVSELRPTLKLLGMNPMDKELERVTFNCDKDMNNEITFEEFVDIIWMLETEEKRTVEARNAFHAFDFLNKGYVKAFDLKAALLYVVEKASEREKEDFIKFFKLDTNRKIYFAEFKEMVTIRKYQPKHFFDEGDENT